MLYQTSVYAALWFFYILSMLHCVKVHVSHHNIRSKLFILDCYFQSLAHAFFFRFEFIPQRQCRLFMGNRVLLYENLKGGYIITGLTIFPAYYSFGVTQAIKITKMAYTGG